MAITIKTICGVTVTNLIILGSVGCSNTPAPWTQQDDSPWGAKHEAEAQNAAYDQAVLDASLNDLNDPVLLADPDPEPVVMQAPEAAPAPELITPVVIEEEPEVVEEKPATQDIMAMLSTNYAVQVFAGSTVESVEKFKTNKDVADLMTVKTDRSDSILYVLVDIHSNRAEANTAAAALAIKTGSKPWVRSLSGLQKIVAQ